MLEGNESSAGLLRSSKARNAENAIGHLESLVTVLQLRLMQADIKPAEDALEIAKQLFTGGEYAKAFHAAKRAESLAITLDERFGEYQTAANALRSRIQSMQRLGLRVDLLEAILARAEEKVLAGTWEDGRFVPNYVEARGLLERAEQEGGAFEHKAERASNGIFMAELAIESLGDLYGPADPVAFSHGATSGLEGLLHDATKELALGNADGATEVARDIVARAEHLKERYADTVKSLDATEAQMTHLRGEGILTNGAEGEIQIAWETLGKGLIEPAAAMASRVEGEVEAIASAYRKATLGLADAELLYSRLQSEGFQSYEAEVAIRDARRLIREANYARAVEHLERALHAFARRTNARASLAKAIETTRKRVQLLQGSGLTFLPDIQEVLTRAEREFQQGNFSGSSEDLRIATVLLGQASRPATAKT
jgi:hypothetical protein